MPMKPENLRFPARSRRSFLQMSAAASAAVVFCPMTEAMLAGVDERAFPQGAVMINLNENPLGPSEGARQAIANIAAQGGRYLTSVTTELVNTVAAAEGLRPEYIRMFAGSSDPLYFSVLAFTSPTKSYVMADPSYESGSRAAEFVGSRVVRVPLTKAFSHDVKAMTAVPDAGLIYLCNPNNPTGTMTSHSDIEYALANKPAGSVLMVDEAYLHFSDGLSALDLVKADKDVIVLRTFSKIYGMAGLRCGMAIARPDLLERMGNYSGTAYIPITAGVAAITSLKDPQLVPVRKKINADTRSSLFEWLDRGGYFYTPSQANFFMIETKRPAKSVIDALARQNVFVGRIWPSVPTYVRVTVGTPAEMDVFRAAFARVMDMSLQGAS
jgi:histidinol-phosphate aminotransferase